MCGPLTLAAILATQRALNVWRSVAVDGRIDATKEGQGSQYFDPSRPVLTDKDGSRFRHTPFNTMYILAIGAEASMDSYGLGYAALHQSDPDFNPLDPINIFSLPDPLKSSLARSALGKGVSCLATGRKATDAAQERAGEVPAAQAQGAGSAHRGREHPWLNKLKLPLLL